LKKTLVLRLIEIWRKEWLGSFLCDLKGMSTAVVKHYYYVCF